MPPGSPPGFGLLCASISAAVEPVATIDAPSFRWGSATWIALMVPIRLVLITSVHACIGGLPFMPAMPACATTMSRPPSCGDAVFECLLQLRGIAYVGLGGDDAPAGLLDEGGRLLEVLRRGHRVADGVDVLAQVHRDDVGAFFGQPDRVAAALPARCPGDEGDLPLQRVP